MATPWKILVLANRETELKPFRAEFERIGREAEFQLVRTGSEAIETLDRAPCDAALITARVSHLHLASVLAEIRRRDALLPILLVCRASEASAVLAVVQSGVSGVLFHEVLGLLVPTLEREIQRYAEAHAQQHRQQRMLWLEKAMAVAPVGLAVADRHGVLHWANTTYLALVGLEAATVEQGGVTLWSGGDERWAELHAALHGGQIWRGSVPAPQTAGIAVDLHRLIIGQLAQSTGEPWYIVARQADGAVVEESRERQSAAQRTELFAAIAGGIAHDLNNILAPIAMAAGILGEQHLSDENVELVRTIEHSAERGAAVIRQVLTFAHGSDNCEMLLQPHFVLREVARLAAEVFPPDIGMRSTIPTNLWPIVGDPGEVQQSLINVLLNARDAIPDGGHIAVTAQNVTLAHLPSTPFFEPEPGDFVEISVEDTGPGLERDLAERIWEPFVTTKGAGQAAGLGLCRVAGVLRSHGGFGLVHARPGAGTKVSLFFPRANDLSRVVESTPAPVAQDLGRILVVDDEAPILKLSRRILEGAGYEVMVASEGREALALFARHRADIGLVLTDLAMPGMNGFTLIWALRRSKPDLRVMVATGQGTEANLRELEMMGVREVLLKPFTSRRLLDAVARTLAEPAQCEPDLFLDSAFANEA